MAEIKVSELPTASNFNDDDYTMIVQNNTSKKITKENMNISYKYSTNEIVVGKWINDKPIYRKVISTNSLLPAETDYLQIPHGISDMGEVVSIKCIGKTDDNMYFDFTNYTWFGDQEGTIHTFIDNTNINILYQGSGNLYFARKAYFILEYTKITD